MRRLMQGSGFLLLAIMGLQSTTILSLRNELLAQAPSPAGDAKVEVKVVKYDGLIDAVKNLKGKLVVVDFWSTT